MAPKLSSKDMEEVINAIQAQLTLIQNHLEDTSTKQFTLEAKNDNLHSHVTSLLNQVTLLMHPDNQNPPPPPQTSPRSSHSHLHQQQPPSPRPPALTLPFFEGTQPLDGLFQAKQYFSFYQIPMDQRLAMMGFHMQGDALSWFKWLHNNNLLTD